MMLKGSFTDALHRLTGLNPFRSPRWRRNSTTEELMADYNRDIFKYVEEIGKLVGFPVSLYRYVEQNKKGRMQELTPNNIYHYCSITYGIAVEGAILLGEFFVAESGHNGKGYVPNVVTEFNLRPFPGCCALCVSTGALVHGNFRRKGVNRIGIKLREALAGYTGYTGLLVTDVVNNSPSIRTIEGAGFKQFHQLKNRRTANLVNLYIKEIV